MDLIKTSFLTGIATIIKIIAGFIVTKIIAIYIGPAGLAVIGQFQNFTAVALLLGSGAIYNGIVKFIAEFHDDKAERSKILSTAFLITVVCSFIISAIILLFYKPLTVYFLKDIKYANIFLIFSFSLILFSLNSFFTGVLNGYREIKKFIVVNIVSSIFTLILVVIFVLLWGLYGALLSLAIVHALVFFVSIFFVINSQWFNIKNFLNGFDKKYFSKLAEYSFMAIITAITIPVAQIIIRNYIADHISMDAAGFWQGIIKISEVYLLVITSSLGVYYMPKLAQIKKHNELRKEIFSGYKIILPIVITMALGIYIFRDIAIKLLFSDKFMAMSNLFAYQLIGDILKVATWLLSCIMTAKAMTRSYIYTEIFNNIVYVLLSIYFINIFGLIGVTISFAISYFISLLLMIWLFRDLLFTKKSEMIEYE